ncbi:hypothetical protein [Pseudogracilibacillus auburnensis]|uniref:hypothetical protein n=1 Tax=Pseudogracilibacillus auburnensis TaxID=1494959 RepID=UPI001A962383|nr:hypothetical protein [Pseudogracilibacillus auburnensis]MBO1004132.1 hypothetical protein [Pseudogracilibacillus auburnensis]
MKIKLKVKHLVWILIAALLFIPLVTFVISPQVSLFFAKKNFEAGKVEGKVKMLELLDGHIAESQKWSIVEDYMIAYGIAGQFDVVTGPSLTMYNIDEPNVSFSWDEKQSILQQYLERGPTNGYLSVVATQLANYYASLNEMEKVDQTFARAMERIPEDHTWDRNELMIQQAKVALKRADFTKAEEIIQQISISNDSDYYYFHAEVSELRAEISINEGNVEEALQEVKIGLKKYKEGWEISATEDPDISFDPIYDKLRSLENRLTTVIGENEKIAGTMKGKITRNDGTPIEGVGVFLQEGEEVNQSISEFERYEVITNEQGEFEFQHVVPGSYQVSLGLMYEQIDGWSWPIDMDEWIDVDGINDITYDITFQPLIEIESPANQQEITGETVSFDWGEVEGAAYYNINVGIEMEYGSVTSPFKSQITDHQLTVPIDELYAKTVGVAFSDEDDPFGSVVPATILAFTNTESRFFWSVEAYKKNGELLSQSNGYRLDESSIGKLPIFYLKEREMTKADKLLLDKQVKKALAAYKTAYENDPNDVHSLRMITRLVREESSQSGIEEEKLALPYLLALADLEAASSEDYFSIFMYYYDVKDWDSFHKWFTTYVDSIGGKNHLDGYDQAIYATALMEQGKFPEARKLFEEAMNKDKSHRFIGNWLAIELYEGEAFHHVIKLANEYPERPLGDEHTNWAILIGNVKEEAEKADLHYEQELQDVLELYFNSKETELDEWLESTKNPAMKKFIKALRTVD